MENEMIVTVRQAGQKDAAELLQMMCALWPLANSDELRTENDEHLRHPTHHRFFVAENQEDGALLGFVESALRSTAEGCDSSPVGYVEAWYVKPDVRRKGIGRLLIASAEEWSRLQGCSEIASDAEMENHISIESQKKLGFAEVGRIVTFRKSLYPKSST
jgi:aminoglycoside 6'-N-acetyltransferase I